MNNKPNGGNIPPDVMLIALDVARKLMFRAETATAETEIIARAILAERERCAAFAYAKHDWPPRWIAASLRGEGDGYRPGQSE